MSDAYGTNGTSKLVDATANQIVGEVNANINKTGALTIASDTSITMSGTGVIKFNNGVGVDANGKLANVANAAQPFTIASPVTLERELRSSPGIQEKMLYTNVSTGTYEIDTTDTQNVYWNAPSGALVANFTGLETSTQRVRRVRIHIVQGGTAYIPTIEVNGVTQTPTDLGAVSSAINSLNIYEYTFYRTHLNTWEIYRQQVDGSLSLVDTQINGDLAFYSDDGATLAGTITNNNNRLEFNNEDGTRMFYFDDTQNYIAVDRPISVSTSHYVSTTKIQQGAGAAGDITIEPGATSGEVIIQGPLTAAGAFTGSRQTISGPGAINLTTLYTEITTTGADTFTLANGAIGQMKIIVMVVDGGNATITPTTFANGTSITMDAVNDSVTMIYGANGWQVIAAQAIDII